MTYLFLAVVFSRYDPLAMKLRVKNTCKTCALHGMPDLVSSSTVSGVFTGIQTLFGHYSIVWSGSQASGRGPVQQDTV